MPIFCPLLLVTTNGVNSVYEEMCCSIIEHVLFGSSLCTINKFVQLLNELITNTLKCSLTMECRCVIMFACMYACLVCL